VPNCPYCNILIDETYNFCVSCEQQVKCLTCHSYLIKDKSKCLNCGSILNKSQSDATPINNFSLEEEQLDGNYSRKIKLSFTDTAIDKVASVLSGHVPLTPPESSKHGRLNQQQMIFPSLKTSADNSQFDESEITEEKTVEITAKKISDNNSASNYFEKDGQEFLISRNHDYKGKNKKLQQQRFSILYVWAYNSLNGEPVHTDHLTQAAQRNGVYDKNYSSYLKEVASRLFLKLDGAFKLNPNGIAQVRQIQIEMQDSDLSGLDYSNSTRKKTSRTSRVTSEDTQKVEQWVQMPSKFDNFDVRELKTLADLAIFSIYIITKELKTENAVKPSLVYEYLTKKHVVSVKKKSFTDALSSKSNEKYFKRTNEGLYYLTQESDSVAENWINQVESSSQKS
jgi:hypothetical protein